MLTFIFYFIFEQKLWQNSKKSAALNGASTVVYPLFLSSLLSPSYPKFQKCYPGYRCFPTFFYFFQTFFKLLKSFEKKTKVISRSLTGCSCLKISYTLRNIPRLIFIFHQFLSLFSFEIWGHFFDIMRPIHI